MLLADANDQDTREPSRASMVSMSIKGAAGLSIFAISGAHVFANWAFQAAPSQSTSIAVALIAAFVGALWARSAVRK
jgi:hypothetical protein